MKQVSTNVLIASSVVFVIHMLMTLSMQSMKHILRFEKRLKKNSNAKEKSCNISLCKDREEKIRIIHQAQYGYKLELLLRDADYFYFQPLKANFLWNVSSK